MPQYNEIQENSDTHSGTGDVTLDGASENGRTFASQIADGVHFPYKITDGAGEWELGIGHTLSGDLVRDTPLDGSASLPVNFTSQVYQVFVCQQAMTTYEVGPYVFAGNTHKTVFPANFVRQTGSTIGLLVDRYIAVSAIFNHRGGDFDAFQLDITSAATAGGQIMFGLYEVGTDGRANVLMAESAYVASTSTGVTTATFTGGAKKVSPGRYFIAVICKTAACTVEACVGNYMTDSLLGVNSSFTRGAYLFFGAVTSPTAMPDPFGSPGSETVSTADPPYIGLRST